MPVEETKQRRGGTGWVGLACLGGAVLVVMILVTLSVYSDAHGLEFDGELVTPSYVFLPSIAARSRPHVPMLGVALERYDEGAGLEEALVPTIL